MSANDPSQPTLLLHRFKNGDRTAGEELLPILYQELKKLAASHMSDQRASHTLQATALVHEAWLKLVDQEARCETRAQFFALASQIMRTILVDHARARAAEKRGGKGLRLELDESLKATEGPDLDLVALDDALSELARDDEELARIVELRFFGGLTAEETAAVLGTSLRSVERGWQIARMRLAQRM